MIVYCAKAILCVETEQDHVDAIVVISGNSVNRSKRTLQIYNSGAAPCIFVAGAGDGVLIRSRLLQAGVPQEKLFAEENARNTKENAEFTVELLRKHGCKKVIIVTSWFHARRALASFRHFGREMEFYSMPACRGINGEPVNSMAEISYVIHEYGGLIWYMIGKGISPF